MTISSKRACVLAATLALAASAASTAAAQAPPAGGVTGGGQDKLDSAVVEHIWRVSPRYTTSLRLLARRLPADASVTLHCIGGARRGCPLRTRRFSPTAGEVVLTSVLRKSRLRGGAIVEVLISLPGEGHKCVEFRVRKRRLPRARTRFLAPSDSVPARCF